MAARQYLVMHSNGQSEIVPADWASTRQGDKYIVFGLGGFQTGGQAYPFYWLPIETVNGVREVTGFDNDVVETIKRLLSAPMKIAVQPKIPMSRMRFPETDADGADGPPYEDDLIDGSQE